MPIHSSRRKKSKNRSNLKSHRKKSRRQSRRRRSKRHSRNKSIRKSKRKSRRRRSRKKHSRKKSKRKSRRRRSRKKHSRKKSKRKSRRRRSRKVSFNFSSTTIPTDPINKKSQTLTIYGMNGCPACENSKKMCRDKNVKFDYYIRSDHEDTVKKIAPGYKYVPVVVDENGKFIGGSIELEEYLKK